MWRAFFRKTIRVCILHNIFRLETLFPLVYFMQNCEDGFQDYFGKTWLISKSALSSINWASPPITNAVVLTKYVVLTSEKRFFVFATETFYLVYSIRVLGLYVSFDYLALQNILK